MNWEMLLILFEHLRKARHVFVLNDYRAHLRVALAANAIQRALNVFCSSISNSHDELSALLAQDLGRAIWRKLLWRHQLLVPRDQIRQKLFQGVVPRENIVRAPG